MATSRTTRVAWAVGACIALALAVPAGAQAITFGANLSRVPDSPYTCADFGVTTCTWESTNPSTGESGFPPVGNGVITKVSVRVGAVTGPMQIVVEEALFAPNPSSPGNPTYACCKAVQLSQVFTPRANATTTVPVNLRVRQDPGVDPTTGFAVDQHLALSVLAPNVPIPASFDAGASLGGWLPAWTLGQERCCPFGTSGATILFNAEWQACGKAGASSAGAQTSKRKKKKRASPCGGKPKKKRKKKQ